jgi:hypothetical protein
MSGKRFGGHSVDALLSWSIDSGEEFKMSPTSCGEMITPSAETY